MSTTTQNSSELASLSREEANAHRVTVNKQEFEKRLDAAIRSAQKPIQLPIVRDFFRDVSAAVRHKSASR